MHVPSDHREMYLFYLCLLGDSQYITNSPTIHKPSSHWHLQYHTHKSLSDWAQTRKNKYLLMLGITMYSGINTTVQNIPKKCKRAQIGVLYPIVRSHVWFTDEVKKILVSIAKVLSLVCIRITCSVCYFCSWCKFHACTWTSCSMYSSC